MVPEAEWKLVCVSLSSQGTHEASKASQEAVTVPQTRASTAWVRGTYRHRAICMSDHSMVTLGLGFGTYLDASAIVFVFVCLLSRQLCCVDRTGPKLIILPQPPECYDCRCASSRTADSVLLLGCEDWKWGGGIWRKSRVLEDCPMSSPKEERERMGAWYSGEKLGVGATCQYLVFLKSGGRI